MKLALSIILLFVTACATKSINRQERTLKDGTMKFCFMGDMGVGNEVQEKVAQLLDAEKCDSIHMLGDLVYPSGIRTNHDGALDKKFLKYYYPISQSGHFPKFNLILGNHDHEGSENAWLVLVQNEPYINFPHPYYLQNWSGLCLVHLDSDYFLHKTDLLKAHEEKIWLESQMAYLRNECSITVALTHHPYKSRGPKHLNAEGDLKTFLDENIIGKFNYLISGHEHILSDEGQISGTHQLISGAGGQKEENEDAGFLVMMAQVKENRVRKISYEFRRLPSPK